MVMIKTYETDLNDVPVTVTYEYEPAEGDGWNNPHFCESVNIVEIKDKNGNIVDDVSTEDEDGLMTEILEALHQDAIDRAADEADYRYDCWKDRNI